MGFKPSPQQDLPGSVTLEIEMSPMPGVWCADPASLSVGLQRGKTDLVRGDRTADSVRWIVEVPVRASRSGELDFHGPLVHGKAGERFLYVSWGTTERSEHEMFRRLKLYLGPLARAGWSQPGISWDMVRRRRPLRVAVSGRACDGTPNCGTAPALWRA